jgi:hypothetical protein
MARPTEGAIALARLRAARMLPRPEDHATLEAIRTSVARAGRTLVEARADSRPVLMLGWQDGSEPVAGEGTGVIRHSPSSNVLLAFAACLRACWPRPDDDPYPGRAVTETEVLATLAALSSTQGIVLPGRGGGAERQYKGVLRLLRATGLLDADPGRIRLGPVVALWPASDIATLRRIHDRLPPCDPGVPP